MKKILIVKISAIGDVVMSLSMLDSLKEYYGNVRITWLCGEIVQSILKEINLIDEIITINEKNIFSSSKIIQLKELVKISQKLAFRKFHKIIIAHTDWRYRLLTLMTKSDEKVAFGLNNNKHLPLGTRYHGVDYAQLATDGDFIKNYKIKYPNINVINSFFLNGTSKKILLFPGGANNIMNEQYLRRWDINSYKELAQRLIIDGYQVVVSGAKSDVWINEYFDKKVLNFVGKTDLLQTISLIKESDLVVTHDSGPLHLSLCLAKKTTISLFGPVLAEARIPLDEPNAIIVKPNITLNCMPCYDGKNFAKCENNICMQNITVDEVFTKIKEVMNESRTK